MFGPPFKEFPEGQEISETMMKIGDGEGSVIHVVEVLYFWHDEFLDQFVLLLIVLGCSVEEYVRDWLVGKLEDACLLQFGEVLLGDFLHFVVEVGVVACHVFCCWLPLLQNFHPCRFSRVHIIYHSDSHLKIIKLHLTQSHRLRVRSYLVHLYQHHNHYMPWHCS